MMLIDHGPGVLLASSKSTDYLSDMPKLCPVCGHLAYWWRNQWGRTVCIHCTKGEDDGRTEQPVLHERRLGESETAGSGGLAAAQEEARGHFTGQVGADGERASDAAAGGEDDDERPPAWFVPPVEEEETCCIPDPGDKYDEWVDRMLDRTRLG